MPDGKVLNAPQVANSSGRSSKVVALNTKKMTVEYKETEGRYENKVVHYASFDSSSPIAATLEEATYAPALSAVPSPDKEGLKNSSRERLIAFVDERRQPTGAPGRELNRSRRPRPPQHPARGAGAARALRRRRPALRADVRDVHLVQWTPAAVADGGRTEVRNADDIDALLAQKVITGPGGTKFKSAGIVVNCPLISIDLP